MRLFLFALTALFFAAPILVWVGLQSAMCGHMGRSGCRIGLDDFIDDEFAMIAGFPWALAVLFFLLAWRWKQRGHKADVAK